MISEKFRENANIAHNNDRKNREVKDALKALRIDAPYPVPSPHVGRGLG